MSITESILKSATEGVDDADRMPEITASMIEAGMKVLVDTSADVDPVKDKALLTAVFTAMWKARKAHH